MLMKPKPIFSRSADEGASLPSEGASLALSLVTVQGVALPGCARNVSRALPSRGGHREKQRMRMAIFGFPSQALSRPSHQDRSLGDYQKATQTRQLIANLTERGLWPVLSRELWGVCSHQHSLGAQC